MALVAILILGVELALVFHLFVLVPSSSFLSDIFASALVQLANTDRVEASTATLISNPLLERAAQRKADDMALKGYFSHEGPNGEAPWRWLDRAGYSYIYAGENLAVNYSDSVDVERAWMESPEHRGNIVSADFTEIGIGISHGMYEGRPATFVVEFFGRPAEASLPVRKMAPQASLLAPKDTLPLSVHRAESVPEQLASMTPELLFTAPRRVADDIIGGVVLLASIALLLVLKRGSKLWHLPTLRYGAVLLLVLALLLVVNSLVFRNGSVASTSSVLWHLKS